MLLSIKKHKNFCFSLFVSAFIYLLFRFLLPVASALTFGFLTAYLMQKPVRFLKSSLHLPPSLSILFLISVFISALFFLCRHIGARLYRELYFYCQSASLDFAPFVKRLFDYFTKNLAELTGKIAEIFSSVGELFPKAVIFISLFFFSAFSFAKDYEKINSSINKSSIFSPLKNSFSKILSGYLKLYSVLFLFTFSCLFLAFTLFDIKLAFTLAFIISVFDALPALGIGIILIPWGILEYLAENKGLGMWLISVFVAITVIKEFIKPKILGDFVGLTPFVSLVSISAGYLLMGATGAFFMPFAVFLILDGIKNDRKV